MLATDSYMKTHKICSNCKTVKAVNHKNFLKTQKIGRILYSDICRECDGTSLVINWKEGQLYCYSCREYLGEGLFNEHAQEKYRNGKCKLCKDCKRARRIELNNQTSLEANPILVDRLRTASKRARKLNLVFDLDENFIKQLLVKQNYTCALSGLGLTFVMGQGRIPTNISIDRIDSQLGYTTDNVQLVCAAMNVMKSDLSMETFVKYCNDVVIFNRTKHLKNEI